jgi:chromosome segregation ATPase
MDRQSSAKIDTLIKDLMYAMEGRDNYMEAADKSRRWTDAYKRFGRWQREMLINETRLLDEMTAKCQAAEADVERLQQERDWAMRDTKQVKAYMARTLERLQGELAKVTAERDEWKMENKELKQEIREYHERGTERQFEIDALRNNLANATSALSPLRAAVREFRKEVGPKYSSPWLKELMDGYLRFHGATLEE